MSRFRGGFVCGLLLLTQLGAGECWGSGETVEPPPPRGSDARNCVVRSYEHWGAKWPELQYTFDTTRHCPYTIESAGSPIPFRLTFRVSPFGVTQLYVSSMFSVLNNQGAVIASGANYPFIRDEPGNPNSFQYSTIDVTYPGGSGVYPWRDSAVVIVYGGGAVPSYPSLFVVMPGRTEQSPPAISGGDLVVAYYQQTWSAVVSEEPNSYRHKWYVDGIQVGSSSSEHLFYTLDPGAHSITLVTTRSDGTTHSVTKNVFAVDCGGPDIC